MGSLDSATTNIATNASDNTAQEATLNTIRSVSGDWDNNNVTLSAINASTVPGISAFDSNGTFVAPNGVTRAIVKLWGGGGSGSQGDDSYGYGGGGGGHCTAVLNLTANQTFAVTVGAGGSAGGNADGGTSKITINGVDALSATGGGRGSHTYSYYNMVHLSIGTAGAYDPAYVPNITLALNGGPARFSASGAAGGGGALGGQGGDIGTSGTAPGGGSGGDYGSYNPAGADGLVIVEFG